MEPGGLENAPIPISFFLLVFVSPQYFQQGKLEVLTWGTRKGERFTITVDGTHLLIQESYHPGGSVDKQYFSHKYNHPGLTYEIATAIISDNIVWVKVPFPAGKSDLKIFKEHGLAVLLEDAHEKAVADATYKHAFVSQRGTGNHDWKDSKSKFRARQESVNRRIKIFRCMQDRWRHDHEFHGLCMRAIVLLTQISFEHNPLMDVISK